MKNLSTVFIASVIAGTSLSACGAKSETPVPSTPLNAPDLSEVQTQADCLAMNLATDELIMDCMKAVSERAEAVRKNEIDKLNMNLEGEKIKSEELDDTIKGLSKVIDIQEKQSDAPDK